MAAAAGSASRKTATLIAAVRVSGPAAPCRGFFLNAGYATGFMEML